MKKIAFVLVALLFATPTFAEPSKPAPTRLEGRWYGPDRFVRTHSQNFELNGINIKAMTATATYWSTQWRCTKDSIPLRITSWDGATLKWTPVSVKDVPDCISTFDGEVTIGNGESIGRLITGGKTYNAVDLVLK